MNSKFLKFGLVAALALCMASCDDVSDTEEGGNGGKTPASTSCTVGQAGVCDGSDVRVCINGIWQTTNCPYGCANGVCLPKPADGPVNPGPSTDVCTAGALRCSGNDLQVCSNNAWSKKETCKNGCDAAKKACKPDSTTEPQTGDRYCDGQVLHYIDSEGKAKTEDCSKGADYGYECQNLKDGALCVFNHDTVKDDCTKEGDIIDAFCTDIEGVDAIELVVCVPNDKNELVGAFDMTVSFCDTGSDGKPVAVMCDYDDESKEMVPFEYPCDSCTESDFVATCDGDKMIPGIGDNVVKNGYVVCDNNCMIDDNGTTCSAACKADGYDYCYANYASGQLQCSKESIDPEKIPYYCGDDTMSLDGVQKTGTEHCNDAGTVAVCSDKKLYCLEKCTSEKAEQKGCEVDDEGAFEYTQTCIDYGQKHLAYGVTDNKDCESTCNADNTACK